MNIDKEITKIISKSKKLKDKNEMEAKLLSHAICPSCLTQTVIYDSGERYCTKCGRCFDVNFYQSHGSTLEDGDRKEIYVPPTTLISKATPTRSFYVGKEMRGQKKELFSRLNRINFYIAAGSSKNILLEKFLRRTLGIVAKEQPLYEKSLIEETALRIKNKLLPLLKSQKKINNYSILYFTFLQLGLSLNLKLLYDKTYTSNDIKSYTQFRSSITTSSHKIMNLLPEEEKTFLRKQKIKQEFMVKRIDVTDKKVNDIFNASTALVVFFPNLGNMQIVSKIIDYKRHEEEGTVEDEKERLIKKIFVGNKNTSPKNLKTIESILDKIDLW